MKMFKKLAVLAAALMLLSVFVSCDNNAEESDAAVVAEFNGYFGLYSSVASDTRNDEKLPAEAEEKPVAKATFYDDNTFKVDADAEVLMVGNVSRAAEEFSEIANGTYEGDPAKDGKVKITVENIPNKKGELAPIPEEAKDYYNGTITIEEGEFRYLYFNFVRVEE